jgi:hypothetical protein
VFVDWGVAAAVPGHNLAFFLTELASLVVYGVLLAFAMQRDQETQRP